MAWYYALERKNLEKMLLTGMKGIFVMSIGNSVLMIQLFVVLCRYLKNKPMQCETSETNIRTA